MRAGTSWDWLDEPGLQAVFDSIEKAGGEAKIAGGAVRNALMALPVNDVDIATTLLPDETIAALVAAGLRHAPTGYEHGTITAITDGGVYEITTLREDIETFGRHAQVRFGTDWERDAGRRDLTINALYCDRNGTIFDPLGGQADVEARRVRFIGNAATRIEEDYLRILRFFRFFAQYGDGRPDAEGLKACTRLKSGLDAISTERIWAELKKTLGATDPSRALLWMRTTGVLAQVLPESAKWGIDLIPALIRAEARYGWEGDAMRRLEAIIRPDAERVTGLARRLKLSNAERARLVGWVMEAPVEREIEPDAFNKRLYEGDRDGIVDRLMLQVARALEKDDAANADALAHKTTVALNWKRPVFPVTGKDLIAAGQSPGEAMGARLSELEKRWIASNFSLSKAQLLAD